MPDMDQNDMDDDSYAQPPNIWMRGLSMIVFAVFFRLAELVLMVAALVQFFWMLNKKEKNMMLADFGESLARWQARTTRFLSGASDDKPFPWDKWE